MAPSKVRAALVVLFFVLAVLRLASTVVSATSLRNGDFLATLPGAYAETWNLTLWDAPDLKGSYGFHRHGYGYGPTQYLTLWPIVFLNSYQEIAGVLLGVYLAIVVGIGYLLWRLCETVNARADDCRWGHAMTVMTAVLLFGPMLTALGQREFEIVQALAIVAAAYSLARGRALLAGGLLGYISMFKYWVVGLLAYFLLKRQWKATIMFAFTVVAVLLVAHALFDLARFPFASGAGIDQQFGRVYRPLGSSHSFCAEFNGTAASVQSGMCAITGRRDGAAKALFYGLVGTAGVMFLAMFAQFERRHSPADDIEGRWRKVLEMCFFLIGAGVVFHGHYYYLSILILPLVLVLYRSFWVPGDSASIKLALGLLAYWSLSAFVVPLGLLSRLIGRDAWSFYLSHGIYVYGVVILVGLLLWEYWMLLKHAAPHLPSGVTTGARA